MPVGPAMTRQVAQAQEAGEAFPLSSMSLSLSPLLSPFSLSLEDWILIVDFLFIRTYFLLAARTATARAARTATARAARTPTARAARTQLTAAAASTVMETARGSITTLKGVHVLESCSSGGHVSVVAMVLICLYN